MGLAVGFDRNDRRLGLNFAGMMLRDRFLGTGLGVFWAIAQPLSLIAVFVFVFSFIFKNRLGIEGETDLSFIIWTVSGYGPWLAINDGLMSGVSSVVSQTGIVKNMAFKTELLPIAATSLGLVPLLVSVAVLVGLIVMDGRGPNAAWTIVPFVLLCQVLFVAGLGLMFGALNVFVRDISFVLPSFLTMVLFLSPVFYPITLYPEPMQEIVQWNPIYVIANGYRDPIVQGQLPPLAQLIYLGAISVVVFLLGLAMFRRLKPYFHSRL
jgi:lipopolysaccharide transport system permease protein